MRRADGILSDSRFLGQPAATLENRALNQLSERYLDRHHGKPFEPLPLDVGHSTKAEVAKGTHGAPHIETPRNTSGVRAHPM